MSHPWTNNAIQFPRLLAEIMATQNLDMAALAESMDLSIDEINELFDRADAVWEDQKVGQAPTIGVTIPVFDQQGTPHQDREVQLTVEQISDIVGHATQLAVIERAPRRSSGDTRQVVAELEEAVVSADLVD